MATRRATRGASGAAFLFALLFPSLLTWAYFVVLSGRPASRAVYGAGKLVQFGFPLLWVALVERRSLRPPIPSHRGVAAGLGFGAGTAAAVLALYHGPVRTSGLLAGAPAELAARLDAFGLASPAGFLAVAAFYCLVHSFLEEYYWRWFVFAGLRDPLGPAAALAVSSLGFMAHHVILLAHLAPGSPLAVASASLGVALGGAAWALIYQRSGSLLGPWLSHLLVDAALMAVGYDLLFGAGRAG